MVRLPAYAQVYHALKKEIIDGDMGVGEFLPPEPDLEKRFAVSRTTIRKAVELLTREGFVSPKQGIGTEILDYRTKQNLNHVTSISETLTKKGYTVSAKNLSIALVPAPGKVAKALEIAEGALVACIRRVQVADGKPIALMTNYIPRSFVPDIEKYSGEIPSLYLFLEEKYLLKFESAHDRISASKADEAEAQMLDIQPGEPLLVMKRICYTGGKPFCFDQVNVVGNQYELEVHMEGRDH